MTTDNSPSRSLIKVDAGALAATLGPEVRGGGWLRPRRKGGSHSEGLQIGFCAVPVDADLKGLRDRAILLLGFAGAFRRSELVALNVADREFCDGGLRVTIHKSKTDQEALGTTIAIARGSTACPVDAG